MKKLVWLVGLLAAGTALANETTLTISGEFKPEECFVGITNDTLNLGRVSFSYLAENEESQVPFVTNAGVEVNCGRPSNTMYFTVMPEGLYGGDAAKFALGTFTNSSLPLGYYTLAVDGLALDGVGKAATLRQRDIAPGAMYVPAVGAQLSSEHQYAFEAVQQDGASDIAFGLKGTLVLPSRATIVAEDEQLLLSAHAFVTSFTVTAVF